MNECGEGRKNEVIKSNGGGRGLERGENENALSMNAREPHPI